MASKAVVPRPERPAPFTLLFCLLILFAVPVAAQQRPGGPSGSEVPEVYTDSFTSTPAPADLTDPLPPAITETEAVAEPATAEPLPAEAPAAQPAAPAAAATDPGQNLAPPNKIVTPAPPSCVRTITAKVVAFDQVYTYNRFGAFNPGGMIYALERDVVPIQPLTKISPGNVQLRPDKRPRPIVLRANEGDCLQVTFKNLLTPSHEEVEDKNFTNQPDKQPLTEFPVRLRKNDTTFTRTASMHINGLDYVMGPDSDDGANIGVNASSLVGVGQTKVYTWYAAKQGQYLLYSMGAPNGNEGDNGQGGLGLFGSVNVEPPNARWYRSQVTEKALVYATVGENPNKTPQIDYEAKYPDGTPVLNMLQGNEIIYTDLNALIVGFNEECGQPAPRSGTCGRDFREFSVLFHDELKAVQAFSKEDEKGNPHSPLDAEIFHGVRDGFAINYGASGLGSIVVANRLKFGPAAACEDCKFEEFFLESWVNGDPALVVKRDPHGGAQALFPDDPSNVHHSYLGDPVRFRNVHIGKETHVFHLHAHQWLQTPRFEDSTYLDSQTISPGASYTYEINYGGSGNRNLTPGDAIFHCHLYPHFAQGMWELWRVHDVFENGTGDRALPDAELGTTPNPAIVPLPGLGMPPMPDDTFRGYPFYIAAQEGKRPPQPPLDFATNSAGKPMDGGLPRHIIVDAEILDGKAGIMQEHPALLNDPVAARVLNDHIPDPNLDLGFTTESPLTAFARALIKANVLVLPYDGTDNEKVAMKFHEGCLDQPCNIYYTTYTPEGATSKFFVNGLPRQPGAPYADPCPPGQITGTRPYAAAYIQFDMPVNRAKWHDRQARILTLENDALATIGGGVFGARPRTPEPLFFRANSGECVIFKATNLIPNNLNLDDFQIFTPTDIMGQHIHLVKFDVTSSDGAGNGWNYEDGTFSPGEVQERVKANNKFQQENGGTQIFTLVTNTKFGAGPDNDENHIGDYVGAQTTVQRWWADPLLNTANKDRTIRTVFTHDHFGPSSHQHHGFYGALVVEKAKTAWTALNGTPLGGREDGGPTSFAANIIDKDLSDGDQSFREFNLAFADFAIVYRPDLTPVNPPGRKDAPLPIVIEPTKDPRPEAISAADPGTQLINYRNEPIPHRIAPPDTTNQYPVGDPRGDLANAFSSRVHGDPFTPVLPAYERDQTVVRLIQGAQEEQHVFNLHGYKWLFEPGTPEGSNSPNDSGYRNGQQIGISEHFEFYLNQPPADEPAPDMLAKGSEAEKQALPRRRFSDHLYSSAATDNLWDGQWGILRVFAGSQFDPTRDNAKGDGTTELLVPDPSDSTGESTITLARLPNNLSTEEDKTAPISVIPAGEDASKTIVINKPVCGEVNRKYGVTAILARDLIPSGRVTYSQRANIFDQNAILFVEDSNLAALQSGTMQPEPLILRANSNECVAVTLKSKLPEALPENNSWNMVPMIVNGFNFNQVRTSNRVGLHSQLVAVNTFSDDGANVGFNKDSTVGPGEQKTYLWYAGDRHVFPNGAVQHTPIEFGATGLRDMGDTIKHASHGAIGALVIEPEKSEWKTGVQQAAADIYLDGRFAFREFVVLYQTDLSLHYVPRNWGRAIPLPNIAETDDSEDSGGKAFNYRTEPLWWRLALDITSPPIGGPDHPGPSINDQELSNILSSDDPNPGCGGACGDPETPLFEATAGQQVRFRVLDVAGHPRQHGFTIHGHHWQFEPWQNNSQVQGFNPRTFNIGSESGIGPTRHVNILTQAGGLFNQPGDYLYRTQESFNFSYGGLWGIFRINAAPRPCGAGDLWCPPSGDIDTIHIDQE